MVDVYLYLEEYYSEYSEVQCDPSKNFCSESLFSSILGVIRPIILRFSRSISLREITPSVKETYNRKIEQRYPSKDCEDAKNPERYAKPSAVDVDRVENQNLNGT